MNALTLPDNAIALSLSADTSLDDWVGLGRTLATRKRQMDWLIGDWITFGRQHFPEQIDLALEAMPDDSKNMRRIEKTAKAFPASLRHADLSFDHHAHVADLPTQEALPLLKEAHDERLEAGQLRIRAMLRKVEIGQILTNEEDHEYTMIRRLASTWNESPIPVREEFAEMIAESHMGVIRA